MTDSAWVETCEGAATPQRVESILRVPPEMSSVCQLSVRDKAKGRIPSLDGIRGLSIWAVMAAHASSHFAIGILHERRVHFMLATMAYFGVTVFFVISGFLITRLLLKECNEKASVDLGRFYRRRAARILPAAALYIAVVLMIGGVTRSQAIYALTFTTTYFYAHAAKALQQLWSLSVEEQFYLLWPLSFCFGVRKAKTFCWAIVVASPFIRLVLKSHGYPEYAHLAPAIGDSLAFGCLLAFYEGSIRMFAKKYLFSDWSFLPLCGLTLGTAGMLYRSNTVLLWGLVPMLIGAAIAAAIERQDYILNHGPLVWTGLLSYSLYLWQQPFLVFDGPLNYVFVRLSFTFFFAYISFRFIEQPALRYFSSKKSRQMLTTEVALNDQAAAGV